MYPVFSSTTTYSGLTQLIKNPNYKHFLIQTKFNDASIDSSISLNMQWFYLRCGYSIDGKAFFNYLSYKSLNKVIEKVTNIDSFKNPYVYDGIELDNQFRFFVKDQMHLIIQNANIFSTPIFIRNLHIYTQFIPTFVKMQYL